MGGPGRPRGSFRLLALCLGGAALAGAAIGTGLELTLRATNGNAALHLPALHGEATWPAGKRAAPGFALRDQRGRLVLLAQTRGRTVVLAFMDSRCTEECPVEGRELAAVQRRLPAGAQPVVLIVSVNPADTPASTRTAARKWGIHGDWHWLMGTRAELRRVWRAYDVTVEPKSGDIVHSTSVYVIDRDGNERAGFMAPLLPPFLADDLRRLA